MTIGEALKDERQNLGLTQKEMVGNILSVAEYSKIENGIHKIDADTLFELLALHQIDFSNFFKEVSQNYIQDGRLHDINYLTLELEKAFYKSDIKRVEQIKTLFERLSDVSIELKLRARLIQAVLENNYSAIDENSKKQIFREIFNQENWIHNQNSLRLFGNSMFLWDFDDISLMIKSVLDGYDDIRKYPNDVEERIAQICVNYLYNGINYKKTSQMSHAIEILKKLDDIPHLIMYKIIGFYFQSYYDGDTEKIKSLKKILKYSGCHELLKKFPR